MPTEPPATGKYVLLQVETPAGWVAVPLDPGVDLESWARAHVAEASAGLEPAEHSIGAEAATAMLADVAARARAERLEDLSHLAFAFQPDPLGRVLALVHVAVLPFDDEVLTIGSLLQHLGSGEGTVGELDRARVDLPVGPAVRARRMVEVRDEGDDRTEPATGADVMEGVAYVALPEGLPGYVWISGAWADVVLGDGIAAYVDELAHAVALDFRQ